METTDTMASVLILLVEDDAGLAELIREVLSDEGWGVAHAPCGAEALAWLKDHRPTLILLDYALPDMHGAQFVEQAAQDGAGMPPFVVVTGVGDERIATGMMKRGAKDYLVKDAHFLDILPLAVGRVLEQIETEYQLARAQQALRESEQRFRTIVETFPGMIWMTRNDPTYTPLYLGGRVEEIYGYPREDFMSGRLRFTDIVFHEDLDRVNEAVTASQAERRPYSVELRFRKPDGSMVWTLEVGQGVYSERGDLEYLIGTSLDITARKRAEEALRESEARVRRKLDSILSPDGDIGVLELADIIDIPAIQSLMDGFFRLTHIGGGIVDLRGKILVVTGEQDICTQFHRVQPETCRNCIESDTELSKGVAPGTFKLYKCKNNMWDIVTPIMVGGRHVGNLFLGQFFFEDEVVDQELFRAQARRYGFDEAEYLAALARVPRWSRETVNTAMTFYTQFTHMVSQLSYGSIQLARSLAQQETLLGALRESEEKYRILVENAGQAIIVAQDGMLKFANRKTEEVTGYKREELTSRPFADFIHPDDRALVVKQYTDRLQGVEVPSAYTFRIVNRAGDTLWVELNVVPITWAGKAATLSFLSDITERKQAEEALAAERSLLRTLIDHLPSTVYVKDVAGRKMLANPVDVRRMGASSEAEVLGKTDFDFYPEDMAAAFHADDQRVIQSGQPIINREEIITRLDGTRGWGVTSKVPLRDSAGQVVGLVGFGYDITERKRAEEALAAERALLRTLVDHLPDSVYVKDTAARITLSNPVDVRYMGAASEAKVLGKTDFDFYPEDMAAAFYADDQRVIQSGQPLLNREEMGIRPDGTRGWILTSKMPLRDSAGQVIGLVGIGHDITEHKQAEEALRRTAYELSTIIESTADGILVVDDQGRVLRTNSRFKDMWRIPDALVASKDDRALLDFVVDQLVDPEGFLTKVQTLYHTATEDWDILAFKDGRFFERYSCPLIEDGDIVGRLWSFRDITERKRAEEALAAERALLRTLVDHLPDLVYVKDTAGRKTLANPVDMRYMGADSEAEALGKTDFDVYPEDMAAAFYADDQSVIQSGQPVLNREEMISRPDGTRGWQLTSKVPLRDSAGQVIGLVGIGHDITERKRLEAERLEMERRLLHAQKLESLGVLAGGIAHDFNNLLTVILGNLELALATLSPTSASRSSIDQAAGAAHRAADLTRQMLAYSGKGQFVVQPIDLSQLVEENAHLFRTSIARTTTLSLYLKPDLPPIEADAGQIQQVIMNLITNASEAIGDKAGVIVLSTGVQDCDAACLSRSRAEEIPAPGRFVYLEVADTGCGMDAETQQRLFDPFFTTKFTGRGLGMSAVLGIVRGHKGAILVDSAPGQGSTVRVLFPAAETPPRKQDLTGLPDLSGLQPEKPTAPALRGTILVVDDEEPVREVCKAALELFGLSVLIATDGQAGVEIFRERAAEIDGVVLDLTMPRMDGLAAFKELRRSKPGVKVILSSGYSEEEATRRFAGHGLDGFLQKPYRLQSLREAVERILSSAANTPHSTDEYAPSCDQ